MRPSLFDRALFVKTLMVTTGLVVAGLSLAMLYAGSVSVTDILGAAITAVTSAYLIHLWRMPHDG